MIEMARLERLKLIGEIAAGIGHEIKTHDNCAGFSANFEDKTRMCQLL